MRPAGLLPTFGIILLLLHCPSSSSAAARRGRKRAAAAAAARADHGAGARGAATGPTVADLVRLATARGIDGRAVDAAMKTEDPRQSLLERIFFEPDPPSLYPLHTLEADPAGQPREVAFSDGHRATLSPAGFPSPKVGLRAPLPARSECDAWRDDWRDDCCSSGLSSGGHAEGSRGRRACGR